MADSHPQESRFVDLLRSEVERQGLTSTRRLFAPGEVIFREGDPGDAIYVVEQGKVEISVLIGDGKRRPISHLGPGEFFGEMAVIDQKPRSASASANEETVTCVVNRDCLWEIFRRSPHILKQLMVEFTQRLRDFDQYYVREVLREERLALVGRFAQSVVHDFKNPLNVIGMAAELAAADDATSEERAEARTAIRKQVERLANMIGEVLEFTRGSQMGRPLVPHCYHDFVLATVADLSMEAAQRLVEVEVENPPPVVSVLMDPQRLIRVFLNLTHNAIDVLPDGGRIRIRFRTEEGRVVTELEDDGPGIPPEIASSLFEAFTTHGKAHGTGLGLAICKKIIEDHGGEIRVISQPGRGATFSFVLPTRQPREI